MAHGHHEELRDTRPGFEHDFDAAEILQLHENLAAIIGIDPPGARFDVLLDGKA